MEWRRFVVVGAAVLAAAAGGTAERAQGFELGYDVRPYRGPVVTWWAGPKLAPYVRRSARAINRAKVGIRLRQAPTAARANIVVGYGRDLRCAGVLGIGWVEHYNRGTAHVARGCSVQLTQFSVSHEFGHALGLMHEGTACATMNAVAIFSRYDVRTKRCAKRDWLAAPYLRDDLDGLRTLYVNHRPRAAMTVIGGVSGAPVSVRDWSSDRDGDIVARRIDWGDGASSTTSDSGSPMGDGAWRDTTSRSWMGERTYATSGTYTITLTVTDVYGRRTSTSTRVLVDVAPPTPDG